MIPVIIVLLIIGCVLTLASFIFRDALSKPSEKGMITEAEIERLLESRFKEEKSRLENEAEKSADYIKSQTERELEKLSNEKIMAVNEYSDQVMDQINKNHNEVMFLYSMLSEKQKELDVAVERLNQAKQRTETEEKLVKHAAETVEKKEEPPKPPVKKNNRKKGQKTEQKAIQKTTQENHPMDEKYSNKEKILKMYQDGNSSLEIAQKLHLGIGEVRLVLELSKERQGK